jgi:hypothetical protein
MIAVAFFSETVHLLKFLFRSKPLIFFDILSQHSEPLRKFSGFHSTDCGLNEQGRLVTSATEYVTEGQAMRVSVVFGFFLLMVVTANCKELSFDVCPGGVKRQEALTKKVVTEKAQQKDGYDGYYYKVANTNGSCYEIDGAEFVYLVHNNQAIYHVLGEDYFGNVRIFVDFGKRKAPLRQLNGVVKGVGYFEYKDGRGIPHKIPRMQILR